MTAERTHDMNRINAEPHALNHKKRTALGRPSLSRTVLVASLATLGLGSVPIQVAHADQIYVDCKVDKLRDAIINASSGAILSLTPGCIYTLTDVYSLADPNLGDNGLPVIKKTLTIKGNGATITRQQSPAVPKFRIFQVANGGDLTLSDLTVDNGDADNGSDISLNEFRKGRGGGVYNLGTLKVINSTFSRNQAKFGGAIGNGDASDFDPNNPAAGDLTLSDSVLFDNSARIIVVDPNKNGGTGGAIANGLKSTMNLTGSTISHNIGVGEGGGVATQGKAILNKCTISGNNPTGVGSVIGIGGGIVNGGPLFLVDSQVTGNTATQGGGIYNAGGQLFLTDSPVTGNNATGCDNSATPCDPNTTGFGGGIVNAIEGGVGGIATLTRSDVTGNSAKNVGGGIVNGAFGGAFGTMTLIQSNVAGNSSTNDGGGIANGGHMTLTQMNVTGNNAMLDGGGVANLTVPNTTTTVTLTLIHTDVTDNKAGQGQHGGGIFNQTGNTVTLNQSTIAGNTPDDCSGVSGC
jgi:hypothetical protein